MENAIKTKESRHVAIAPPQSDFVGMIADLRCRKIESMAPATRAQG